MQKEVDAAVLSRFWYHTEHVGDCIEWRGSLNRGGYGQFNSGGHRPVLAHRFSYEANIGSIPKGMLVCHKCDNRKCVKPDHLFVGTYGDNNRDMFAKGRGHVFDGTQALGVKNVNAKLTEDQAAEIKGYLAKGASLRFLADRFGVTPQNIKSIRDGGTWAAVAPKDVAPVGPVAGKAAERRGEQQGSDDLG